MTIVRIQIGHVGRTSGATGAYNPRLDLKESTMNDLLADAVASMVKGDSELQWQFVGPDVKLGDPCHMFVSLHMDGNDNPAASGPSVGYPPASGATAGSKAFAELWKEARLSIPGALPFRADNYTPNLTGYYGWFPTYSGSAPVKVVIENGFVTNDAEAKWAIENRAATASALVATIRRYYGLTGPTPIDDEVSPVDEAQLRAFRYKLDRAAEINQDQANRIGNLQGRVTTLETRVDALIMEADAGILDRLGSLEEFVRALRQL